MVEKFVEEEDLKLSYLIFGEGSETVVCLHGHGKNAEDFLFLKDRGIRVISINLFLHGKSTFSNTRINDNLITKNDVEKLLGKLLIKEKVEQFHLIAYSQGGRFALSILPYFSVNILSLHLLAIDGLNDKNFYSWSQRRWWARKLFKRWTEKPNELISIAKFLVRIKLIHPKIVDFLNFYAADRDKITLAYKTWSAFRKLRPNPKILKPYLNNKSMRFKLIIGERDKIITAKSAKNFLQEVKREDALIIIDAGHDFFRPEIIEIIDKEIKFI